MSMDRKSSFELITGIACITLAVIVFIFASGLRKWYSGLLFLGIGILTIIKAIRRIRTTSNK